MRSTEGNWGISAEREDALNNCPVSSGRELYDVHLDLRAAVRAEYLVGAVPQFRGVSSGGLLGGAKCQRETFNLEPFVGACLNLRSTIGTFQLLKPPIAEHCSPGINLR